MREILFRGKRLDNGEWVEGYYLHLGPVDLERAYIIPAYASALYTFEVDPATVGQFTGLYANGKRIFEGDILKNRRTGKTAVVKAEVWNCGCCHNVFGFSTETTNVDLDSEYSEFIGNIHDNPELLKEGEVDG